MNGIPPNLPDPSIEDLDPRLAALVGAILDGGTIDWALGANDASASFFHELRIVADVANVQRSIASADSAIEASAFPPHLPWHADGLVITESLGKGAFGEVFRAWDTQLHRDVALKLLFRDSGHEMDADRFLEEGRLLAKVRHPNVVTVHGAERIDGRPRTSPQRPSRSYRSRATCSWEDPPTMGDGFRTRTETATSGSGKSQRRKGSGFSVTAGLRGLSGAR